MGVFIEKKTPREDGDLYRGRLIGQVGRRGRGWSPKQIQICAPVRVPLS